MQYKKIVNDSLLVFITLFVIKLANADTLASKPNLKLTYLGAEIAANVEKTIPQYSNESPRPPESWISGNHYLDPFSDDNALFKIDKSNLDIYRSRLSLGQIKLISEVSDYYLKIYKTRRSSTYPKFIREGTLLNRTQANLSSDGNGLINYQEGFPFPILSKDSRKAALQSLWNHRTRYRGGHVERTVMQTTVFDSDSFTPVKLYQRFSRAEHLKGIEGNEHENVLFYYLDKITSPVRLSGTTILVHETLNQTAQHRRAWIYNQAHKRVRRAPSVAYDAPVPGTYGLRTADSYDMFNGSSDKYDWHYLGKQELYIPYNSYRLTSSQLAYKDMLKSRTVNPEVQRWELHRVHKLEARLKLNERHIYGKRVFYLDEDTWTIVLTEQYDQRGELWRISEGHLINYYDQNLPYYAMEVTYDLLSRHYNVFGLSNEEEKSYSFSKIFSLGDYVPSALRRNTRG